MGVDFQLEAKIGDFECNWVTAGVETFWGSGSIAIGVARVLYNKIIAMKLPIGRYILIVKNMHTPYAYPEKMTNIFSLFLYNIAYLVKVTWQKVRNYF